MNDYEDTEFYDLLTEFEQIPLRARKEDYSLEITGELYKRGLDLDSVLLSADEDLDEYLKIYIKDNYGTDD